jgi:hypothetical protein
VKHQLALFALCASSWGATITSGSAGLHYSTAGGAEYFANGSLTGPDFTLSATAFSGGIGSLAPYCFQVVDCTFNFAKNTGFSSLPFSVNDNGTIYNSQAGYFLDFSLAFTGPSVTVSPFVIPATPPFRAAQRFFTFPSVPITATGTFTVSTAPNGGGNILVSGSFNLPGTAVAGFQDEGGEYAGNVRYNFATAVDPPITDAPEPVGLLGAGLVALLCAALKGVGKRDPSR